MVVDVTRPLLTKHRPRENDATAIVGVQVADHGRLISRCDVLAHLTDGSRGGKDSAAHASEIGHSIGHLIGGL